MTIIGQTLVIGGALGLGYALGRYLLAREQDATREKTARDEPNAKPKLTEPATKPPPPETKLKPTAPKTPPKPKEKPKSMPSTDIVIELPSPANLKQRINWSKTDENKTVVQPPTELLKQALRYDPHVTLDELTGARLAASEHASGSFAELCCIVDSELNRAERKGKSLYESLTYKDTFGKQGGTRRASTRRDPRMRHLLAARAVISGKYRGISRGAERFYDPKAQLSAHRKWRSGKSPRRHCHPLVILERWSFDYRWDKRSRSCALDRRKPGKHKLQWVGPIHGVDPLRLLLMRPATDQHQLYYEITRDLLKAELGNVES